MNTNYSIGWHVLYVRSRCEKKVHSALAEMSIDSFLPLVKTLRKWSDRKKVVFNPLFPSYVFVNINSSLDFYRALSVTGASAYIKFGNEYAVVRDSDINRIKVFLNLEGVSEISTTHDQPKVGEVRKVDYGPLSGLGCEVMRIDNEDRILVRIDSIKKNITATISPKYLSRPITNPS